MKNKIQKLADLYAEEVCTDTNKLLLRTAGESVLTWLFSKPIVLRMTKDEVSKVYNVYIEKAAEFTEARQDNNTYLIAVLSNELSDFNDVFGNIFFNRIDENFNKKLF